MMQSPIWFLAATLWSTLSLVCALPGGSNPAVRAGSRDTTVLEATPLLAKRDDTSVSLDWVQRWAAIGDSFTAGIGSGEQIGKPVVNSEAWFCSRYTYTWPRIVDNVIGAGKKDFQYIACSGDRSEGIYKQANNLKGDLDVVMLTAGGNDLCLAAMIRTCVILPYSGEDACTKVINKAQENIDKILKGNIRQILEALKPKMKKNGIVIYSGYAPFFNTNNEDCAKDQRWAMPSWGSWRYWFGGGLTLTIDRRKKFNDLVGNINKAIKEVVVEFQNDRNKKYDIEFSDWSEWPAEVDGQMCSPSSDGSYPDENQPEMQFIKPNTWTRGYGRDHDLLRRRELNGADYDQELPYELTREEQQAQEKSWNELVARYDENINFYDSILYKSPDPRAVARHRLDKRAPVPPECPGDGGFDPTLGLGLPDTFGRIFHPNPKGHETIAAFALQNLAWVRSAQLGNRGAVCDLNKDEFKCWAADGSKAFTSWTSVDSKYKEFCKFVDDKRPKDGTINWHIESERYFDKTPDVFTFKVQLKNGAKDFNLEECEKSLDRIINSCDASDNPMNWKKGGKWVRGSYEYSVNPKKDREWMTRPDGSCGGWYKWAYGEYSFYGKGWANNDWGQNSLLSSARNCVGSGVTSWFFEYYDKPSEHDGWEWHASFNTPIWVRQRCFNNNKVQRGAGGYTHKWRSNFGDQDYNDGGCDGSD